MKGNRLMKVMFIVYHDLKTEARSQEILECAKKIGKKTILVSYSKPYDESGCKCILTGRGKRNYFTFIKDSLKAIKRENPDVVILHDNYTAFILWWLKKYRKNVYVIYDSSELYIDKKYVSFKSKIASHMEYFEKNFLKHADIVIAANIERARIMQDYFQLKEVPIIFDNMHRIDESYSLMECEDKFGNIFSSNCFHIVYGGGISKQRLTFELAETVGKLGDKYRLIVVGNSTDSMKSEFNNMINNNKYSNIFYLGFVSRNELKYLFKKANISVSIFAQDTINNINCASGKLYEGLFEGTPILTSENPPLKRICLEHKVGVSTNNFKEGILELEKNYDHYYRNVKNYTQTLDIEGRKNVLVETIRARLEAYGYLE